jgi:hypothetical protein
LYGQHDRIDQSVNKLSKVHNLFPSFLLFNFKRNKIILNITNDSFHSVCTISIYDSPLSLIQSYKIMSDSMEIVHVTGDNSLVEAINLKKIFIYQLQSWKFNLMFNIIVCKLSTNSKLSINSESHTEIFIDEIFRAQFVNLPRSEVLILFKQLSTLLLNHFDSIRDKYAELSDLLKNHYDVQYMLLGMIEKIKITK